MKIRTLILAILCSAALLFPSFRATGQSTLALQQSKTLKKKLTKQVNASYLLFLPRDYRQKGDRRWPLILFLHGAGERGADLDLVKVHGPPKIVERKNDFPFIVVSPQCPAGERWSNDVLLALLDDVTRKWKVDESRIYLTGLSMGGFGTWSLALEQPARFAAIAPICGGGDVIKALLPDPKKLPALKSLAVWAFHGAKDQVVKLEESERMVTALRKLGCVEVDLTVYPDAGHDAWTDAYNDSKLYDWFLNHQRKTRL